jgi:aconitase A
MRLTGRKEEHVELVKAYLEQNNMFFTVDTGKKPQVAPYSGAMLAIVARSANGKSVTPGPKNSTNLPTTPLTISRSCNNR